MYLIVEFEGEGTTGPVAKSWYADGYSWWPPYKDIDRLLKSVKIMETPQPEKGWTRHKTRILHESASFHNVANNWKKASYTSDINSEPEIAGKRIPKKKLCSNHIYSSDDEAPEQPPLKKRKSADKESLPPAPKPPSIPKRTKKKGPVVQPQVLQSRAVNSLSNSFVNQQQCDMEDQQQTWCESLPSFQAPVRVSQPDHHGDGWSVDPPNTQEHTFSVMRPSGDHLGRTQTTVGISQADHHGAGWSVHPPNTQEHTFSVLRPSGEHQGRTQTTVGIPQPDHHGAGWSVDPPNTQEHTFSVLRPSGDCDHQGRTQTTVGISQADHHGAGYGVDPPNTQEHTFSVLRPSGDHQGREQSTSGVRQENPVLRLVPNQCTSVERAILETLEKMDMKINHLTSLVQSLVGNRRFLPPVAVQNDEEDGIFPLASTEDLDRLEQSLSDRGFMQRMVNRLSISGGPTMKKTVWRICTKVFSTNVARQLNWCGRGDKRGIRRTNVGSLLTASAMRNPVLPSPTEAEAEKYIKDFLRLAPGRE
ncbi:uncharacterized protein LOC125262131 [Megalobrama amblycephala]|uniref:uncharacterized protein LOC125262131 n=1 Tax=Megalobrama amblycephala TaxID=75352 RepID=UPI0020145C2A|nr:uncharacterized protein LOC125244321 isoform X1 [Megalobrama amblycephala]XP_048033934.1 uncharacterized protein LOC125259951 isoform X1 [Megalobrama amblycephala]XP_048036644.1 uncharacterized protein LOC125262131 [Megalobrama amblycephala]